MTLPVADQRMARRAAAAAKGSRPTGPIRARREAGAEDGLRATDSPVSSVTSQTTVQEAPRSGSCPGWAYTLSATAPPSAGRHR